MLPCNLLITTTTGEGEVQGSARARVARVWATFAFWLRVGPRVGIWPPLVSLALYDSQDTRRILIWIHTTTFILATTRQEEGAGLRAETKMGYDSVGGFDKLS